MCVMLLILHPPPMTSLSHCHAHCFQKAQSRPFSAGCSVFTEFPFQCCSIFLPFIPLISLFLLLKNANPRAPTLERAKPVEAGPLQALPPLSMSTGELAFQGLDLTR